MSMSTALAKMVLSMIKKNGQAVTVTFVEPNPVYDPETGSATPTVSTKTSKAVFIDFSNMVYGQTTKSGSMIEMNDKQVYIQAGSDWARSINGTGDYITDAAGQKWRVITVKEYNPTGVLSIMFDLHVRKG